MLTCVCCGVVELNDICLRMRESLDFSLEPWGVVGEEGLVDLVLLARVADLDCDRWAS